MANFQFSLARSGGIHLHPTRAGHPDFQFSLARSVADTVVIVWVTSAFQFSLARSAAPASKTTRLHLSLSILSCEIRLSGQPTSKPSQNKAFNSLLRDQDSVVGFSYEKEHSYLSILSCEISAPVLSDFRFFNPFCGDLVAGKHFF